jgi:hypothetical protein
MSQVSLSSGLVLEQVTENGPFVARDGGVANSVLSDLLVRDTPHPTLPAKKFVMAERVSAARRAGGLATNYVGLWQGKDVWSVFAYTQGPDGRFSAPLAVLSSRQPLRSMSYFPHADSPAGRLGLVQENGVGNVSLINVHWAHPASFR